MAPKPSSTRPKASTDPFTGYTSKGEYVTTIKIHSPDGMAATISTLGARLLDLRLADQTPLLLPLRDISHMESDDDYVNAVVGRVANRIANGRVTLYDSFSTVQLPQNDGVHTLHGGVDSWDRRVYTVQEEGPDFVTLDLQSPDGDNCFPSAVHVQVCYRFTGDSQLTETLTTTNTGTIQTITNMTTHPYFDLTGNGGTVENAAHNYTMHAPNCATYLKLSSTEGDSNIPSGEITPVSATRYDFQTARKINPDDDTTGAFEGYDNYWIHASSTSEQTQSEQQLHELVKLTGPATQQGDEAVQLSVWSDQPGFQMYTAGHLNSATSPLGYAACGCVAIEPSGFIDACNHDNFPPIDLKPNETRTQTIQYRFAKVAV